MDLTAKSLDISSIEHVWGVLVIVTAHRHAPQESLVVKSSLIDEWNQLPQEFLDTHSNTMLACSAACIAVQGGHTQYLTDHFRDVMRLSLFHRY